ncbi:hypothetical protein PTKIN_Ptkin09bG0224000 [Pterospermum kingtungense]
MMDPKWLWMSVLLLLLEGCRWSSTNACLEDERIALLQLKPFFNNPYNNNLRSWVEKAQGSDCCQWERVECNTSSRRVIGLSLNFTRFVLPVKDVNVSLFLPFKKLKRLDLSGNSISGFVENEGLTKLSFALENLEILDLSDNYLHDTILSSLSQLSSLKHLYLASNSFSGSNHEKGFQWLSRLHNLETLDLNGNSLKNNIMFHTGSLSSLKTLSLSENNLKGMVHLNELNNLTKLKNLDLSGNGIERLRPISNQGKEIGQLRLTNLEVLDLSDNLLRNNTFAFISGLSSLKSLNMAENQLNGSIDITELNNLTKLKNLDLSGNEIERLRPISNQGKETNQLRLTNLEVLDLSNNLLRNNTFAFISDLSSLKSLNMRGNQLNGSIDITEYRSLRKLKRLYLNEVFTNGSSLLLLKLVEAFPSVKIFYLQWNYLNNTMITTHQVQDMHVWRSNVEKIILDHSYIDTNILQSIGVLTSLKTLSLDGCGLIGSLPHQGWCELENLEELYVSGNALEGTLPYCMDGNNFVGDISTADFSDSSLRDIDLSDNNLHGKLPRGIGNLSSLSRLAFSNNQFDGSIPMEFCNLFELEFLELSRNNLSGSIPSCVNSTYISYVHLNGNRLSGPLKLAFNSSSLVTLDLGGNNLSGTIPEWIGTLSALSVLLLKANHLGGEIPDQLCKLYSLSIIDLSQNMFSGLIPSCLGNLTLVDETSKSLSDEGFYGASMRGMYT